MSARISQKPHIQISPNFRHMLAVAAVRCFSDGKATGFAFLVLWMTSCFFTL